MQGIINETISTDELIGMAGARKKKLPQASANLQGSHALASSGHQQFQPAILPPQVCEEVHLNAHILVFLSSFLPIKESNKLMLVFKQLKEDRHDSSHFMIICEQLL